MQLTSLLAGATKEYEDHELTGRLRETLERVNALEEEHAQTS